MSVNKDVRTGTGMRVHFASGEHPFPAPWWNVDYLEGDQRADLLDELPDNLVDIERAYVGHFLEHLTVREGVSFLTRVRKRMAPRGRLIVIGPDVVRGKEHYARGLIDADLLYRMGSHGEVGGPDGRDRSHCHLWDCTGADVVSQVRDAGWPRVAEFSITDLPTLYPEVPVISLATWQFAVTARV